jgi:DNA ligase (NAD+)
MSNNNIKGKYICFTGKMEKGDRTEMKLQAKKLGANIQSDVNSKTDILVHGVDVAHNSKHTKMIKAQKLGITIMDEDIYYAQIK